MPDISNQQLLSAMTQQLSVITDVMATRDDIAYMATKDDIKGMATKDDVKGMATKDDIADMATKADISKMATKEDIKAMATKDDIKGMATKDDLKKLGDDMRSDFDKLGARFEDLDHKFDTALEAINKDQKLRRRVDYHGQRIGSLETDNKLTKLAIKQMSSK